MRSTRRQPRQHGVFHFNFFLAVVAVWRSCIFGAKAHVSPQVPAEVSLQEQKPFILSNGTVSLPHKPTAPLSYGFAEGRGSLGNTHLLVFLNGLLGTQTVWHDTVEKLAQSWDDDGSDKRPNLLTYDRYGQGDSARDPYDETHEFGHDLREVVRDLEALVAEVWRLEKKPYASRFSRKGAGNRGPKLIFVANSMGCVVGRYFEQMYPGTTSALLLLDSNIANSDQISLFPDPDAPDFDPRILPDDVTVDVLRRVRESYRTTFGPDVRNPENFDRRNVAALLPHADRPALRGSEPTCNGGGGGGGGRCPGPWITVVGHDPEKFADDGAEGSLNCPRSLTNAYVNPA